MRPFLGCFLVLFSLAAFAATPIKVQIHAPFDIDGELRSTWRVSVTNRTAEPQDVRMSMTLSNAQPESVMNVCAIASSSADCAFVLPANSTREIAFVSKSFKRFDSVSLAAHAIGKSEIVFDTAVFGREYFVTTTADAGPGSLRQAMLDVNRDCEFASPSCVIRFAIDGPVPEEGWFTIAPLSPLPAMTSSVAILGATQSAHTGETNPSGGPEIVLDGRAAGEGHGLTLRSSARVSDLAIRRFRGNGIDAGSLQLYRNHIGPNTGRGVMLLDGTAQLYDNAIEGNGRAGVFLWTPQFVRLIGNVIAGNGASGLFFHRTSQALISTSGYAADNVFANNAHAGIGLSLVATGDFARNDFRDNGAGAIDVGLDGPTLATIQGNPGFGGVIGAPVITAACYENGATIVTGRNAPKAGPSLGANRVAIFAGAGDVQELVATTNDVDFTVTIPRDLRGQAIRAVTFGNYIYDWDYAAPGTSEMSEPRVVE